MDKHFLIHTNLWISVNNLLTINTLLTSSLFIHRIVLGIIHTNYAPFKLSTVSTMAITTIKDISIKSLMANCLCEHREN